MTWTYTNSPSVSRRDYVRVRTGDTNPSRQILQDEEIEAFLIGNPTNMNAALAEACEAIAAYYATQTEEAIGPLRRHNEQKFKHYTQMATRQWQLSSGLIPDSDGGGSTSSMNMSSIGIPSSGGLTTERRFNRMNWDTLVDEGEEIP